MCRRDILRLSWKSGGLSCNCFNTKVEMVQSYATLAICIPYFLDYIDFSFLTTDHKSTKISITWFRCTCTRVSVIVESDIVSATTNSNTLKAKLHYTDTGYEHRLRTPPTDKLTTILQQICHIAMPEANISTCQDVGNWDVANFCPLVVFVGGVRSRCS